jgi:phosphoglycerate dehydrogenase-like enzyme
VVRITNDHVNSLPIAEFVMRAVLDGFQGAGQWRSLVDRQACVIHDWREVSGSPWLVVGLGGIGSAVVTRARAFGATVIGSSSRPHLRRGLGDPEDQWDRRSKPFFTPTIGGEEQQGDPRHPAPDRERIDG